MFNDLIVKHKRKSQDVVKNYEMHTLIDSDSFIPG